MKDSNIICALVCCHKSDKVMLLLCAFQGRADGISKGRAEKFREGRKKWKGTCGIQSEQPFPLEFQLLLEMAMQELRQRLQNNIYLRSSF